MMDASERHEAVVAEVQITTVSIKVLKIGKTGNFLLGLAFGFRTSVR